MSTKGGAAPGWINTLAWVPCCVGIFYALPPVYLVLTAIKPGAIYTLVPLAAALFVSLIAGGAALVSWKMGRPVTKLTRTIITMTILGLCAGMVAYFDIPESWYRSFRQIVSTGR